MKPTTTNSNPLEHTVDLDSQFVVARGERWTSRVVFGLAASVGMSLVGVLLFVVFVLFCLDEGIRPIDFAIFGTLSSLPFFAGIYLFRIMVRLGWNDTRISIAGGQLNLQYAGRYACADISIPLDKIIEARITNDGLFRKLSVSVPFRDYNHVVILFGRTHKELTWVQTLIESAKPKGKA